MCEDMTSFIVFNITSYTIYIYAHCDIVVLKYHQDFHGTTWKKKMNGQFLGSTNVLKLIINFSGQKWIETSTISIKTAEIYYGLLDIHVSENITFCGEKWLYLLYVLSIGCHTPIDLWTSFYSLEEQKIKFWPLYSIGIQVL